jgi:acyl-CoA reductase-like NAD-dependent aldehyde dehydrogenase
MWTPPAAPPAQTPNIVDGRPLIGDGPRLPIVYPATGQQIGEFVEAGPTDVDAAVMAARRAFETGRWRRMGAEARVAVLGRIHDLILAHADELAWLETLNTGLPVERLKRVQIGRAAWNFRFFGEVLSQSVGQAITQDPRYLTTVTREPVGVAALIAPWNAPVALASMKVAAAIAFGNSCVLKPSEMTPLAIHRMVELIHEAGVPPGVVNLIHGRGHVTGAALVDHPEVDLVSFTGGTETGRAIGAAAGRRLIPTTMELGGKSANIVFEDADFETALDGALLGIFSNNGQQCLAGSRILVQRSIADSFIDRFVERAGRLKIGDPMNPATELGPLISAAHRARVLSFADGANDQTLLTGGQALDKDGGFYIQPTAVLAKSNAARAAQAEIFGPFATFVTFDTQAEAVAIANDSKFGLASYVWTTNLSTGLACARDIRAGVVWVNTPMMRELRAPFGGFKESGVGREGAQDCLAFYTEAKTTSVAIDPLTMQRLGV